MPQAPSHRVLLVEREGAPAAGLRELLPACGHEVFAVATTADEALTAAAEGRPELALVEVRLDGSRDGISVATLLRERHDLAAVLVGEAGDVAALGRSRAAAPVGWLTRPVSKAQLAGTLELAHQQLARERGAAAVLPSAERLETTDRLASLGTLAGGIAHEINNPLAVVVANAEYTLDRLDHLGEGRRTVDQIKEAVDEIREASARVQQILVELRVFSRAPGEEARGVDLEHVLDWAVRTTAIEFRGRARVEATIGPLPRVLGSEPRLAHVLVSLLLHAARSIPAGDAERQRVRVSARVLGGRAIVEVADTAAALSSEAARRLFDPFYVAHPGPSSSGMGLSVCHAIAASLGGSLTVASETGKGNTLTLVLPLAASA